MCAQRRQLGERTLRVLAAGCTLAVLDELALGTARPVELGRRLPESAHSAIMRALAGLASLDAVSRRRHGGVPHRTTYTLTLAGLQLLDLTAAAARWESRYPPAGGEQAPPGAWPLRLLGDAHARAILLALAERELTLPELHGAWSSQLGRSALRKRLAALTGNGTVRRARSSGATRYELDPRARALTRTALLAGRWELTHARPRDARPAADLESAFRMILPALRIDPASRGRCRLILDAPGARSALLLAADRGRLPPLCAAGAAEAQLSASPREWCRALLDGAGALETVGNRRLADEVLAAITATLGP
jgi:DNA-binding HxlR family transcriptional regulator